MKVILTGSTGLIGSGVLKRCLSHPSITSIIALTRRPLEAKDPKLNNIIKKDYLTYSQAEIEQLKAAEACIWVLGSPTSGREVHIDYTQTAMKTFLESVVPELEKGKIFRFVYTSGGLVPYLESNLLFFLGQTRKARAILDREVLATETENTGRWESYVARPWFVADAKPNVSYALGENSWILREDLAAAMVDAALEGGEPRLMDNATLKEKGRLALERTKL